MTTATTTGFLTAWAEAERTRDVGALDRMLADDFVGVGPMGFSLPKEAWLARHQGDALRYETFALGDVHTRPYGDTAVVTAEQDAVGTHAGHPVPRVLRDTFVLVRDGDGDDWRLASLHMSFVAGTPGAPPIPGQGRPLPSETIDDQGTSGRP